MRLQALLLSAPYACGMATNAETHDLTTASGRIAYAIAKSGKTLERIAEEMGCTHATLSQWQRGKTDPTAIKSGLMLAFCDATGFDMRWLLTGHGPQVSRYVLTSEVARVATALLAMERRAPQQVETVVRMLEAASAPPVDAL